MKAVIFAGGFGTRISEESAVKPKPMVEIGGRPILWHIMKIYASYGINDFVIACGYQSQIIKNYFVNYSIYQADVTVDMTKHTLKVHKNGAEPWRVTLVETGVKATKSQRLLAMKPYLGRGIFCLTYGDGVSDLNIRALIKFHRQHRALVTITAVQPPGRFGGIVLKQGQTKVTNFKEKPDGDGAWINGGFMVVDPKALSFIKDPAKDWEEDAMRHLARAGKLAAYKHKGFWQSMDTLRDKHLLEKIWATGKAPWKVWRQ
jgi:glucose-1-phosphate cytidylyltransferase